jgi:hypothetical protein
MKPGYDKVVMLDGRVFWTRDDWATVYLSKPGQTRSMKVVDKEEADLARFLAVAQASASA